MGNPYRVFRYAGFVSITHLCKEVYHHPLGISSGIQLRGYSLKFFLTIAQGGASWPIHAEKPVGLAVESYLAMGKNVLLYPRTAEQFWGERGQLLSTHGPTFFRCRNGLGKAGAVHLLPHSICFSEGV